MWFPVWQIWKLSDNYIHSFTLVLNPNGHVRIAFAHDIEVLPPLSPKSIERGRTKPAGYDLSLLVVYTCRMMMCMYERKV